MAQPVQEGVEEQPGRAGRVLRFAGASAVGLVSLIGLTTLLGTAVYAVLGLLALTSPHLWTRVRTMTRPRRHNQPTHETSCPDPGEHEQPYQPPGFALPLQPPSSLSDETLCQAWTNTHRLLQKPLPPHVRVDVVQFRQACLDELEHRHPEEVSAWLATGGARRPRRTRFATSPRASSSGPIAAVSRGHSESRHSSTRGSDRPGPGKACAPLLPGPGVLPPAPALGHPDQARGTNGPRIATPVRRRLQVRAVPDRRDRTDELHRKVAP